MAATKKILSIDDQASISQMIQFTLDDLSNDRTHYQVDIAYDGKTGVELALETTYDLIITDQKMPGDFDGLDVIRALRKRPEYKNTPIVMLTMETTDEMRDAARAAGASGWMNKPFTPASLVAMVQRVLR